MNGTSWTEVAELTTTRGGSSGNGTGLLGFTAGGEALREQQLPQKNGQ